MVSGFQARSYEALSGSAHAQPTATASAAFGLEEVRAVQMRTRQIRPAQGRAPEIGDRLFSEPTAGTQPCGREPLFMPHCGHCLEPVAGLLGRKPVIPPP